ncbi:MAG TPA: AarF/UbiB family protein [Metalysinibacillus sp.]
MLYIKFAIEIAVVGLFIYVVTGRLIGTKLSFAKRLISVLLSLALTTFVYWYSYLQHTKILEGSLINAIFEVSTLVWIGSMLLIAMLLYLVFELFDPIGISVQETRGQRSIFARVRLYWRQQKRLRQVLRIAVTNGVVQTIKYARQRENERELAIALRRTLEQCGGIFIKFGQVLSTRKELFSPIFIEELAKLQQGVPPLSESESLRVLAESLPGKVDDVFSSFNAVPIASASIGQVHRAELKTTREQVVVKLLRPEVKEIMINDVSILVEFASWFASKSAWAANLGFKELAIGFADGLSEEIHFDIEVRNTVQVSNVLKNSAYQVRIPHMYTQYCGDAIIVMEFIEGASVADADFQFRRLNIDRKEFARTVLFSFFEQMLHSGIFHADPHPGNIFIDEHTGQPVLIDFGAVGRLGAPQQEGLKLFLMGIQQADASILYDGLTLLVEENDPTQRARMEQAIDQLLLKVSFVDRIPTEELIYALFKVVRDFKLAFYPSVALALRSFVTLDGTLRVIDPSFDIFTEAKAFSARYMRDALFKPFKEPKATRDKIEEELAQLLPNLRKMPRRIDHLLQRVESGKIILHHDIFSDEHNAKFITQLFSQMVLLFVGITFGIISVALLAISQFIHAPYAVYLNTTAYLGLFLCAILLVRLSIQALRNTKE